MRSIWHGLIAEGRRDLRAMLDLVAPRLCEVCGAPWRDDDAICAGCRGQLAPADRQSGTGADRLGCVAAFRYEGRAARELVRRFKYGGARHLRGFLGREMARAWRVRGPRRGPVAGRMLLVPVPLAPARRRLRGYNQALLLAQAAGAELGAPVLDVLRRVRSTPSQTRLTQGARMENIKTVFAAGTASPYLPVVLIDDVWTTGATLRACRRALVEAGHRVPAALTAFWTPPAENQS